MKSWKAPDITELDISETAHDVLWGTYSDGGYLGDSHFGQRTDDPNHKQPDPVWDAIAGVINGVFGHGNQPEDTLS